MEIIKDWDVKTSKKKSEYTQFPDGNGVQNQFKVKVKKHFVVNTKIWENQFE